MITVIVKSVQKYLHSLNLQKKLPGHIFYQKSVGLNYPSVSWNVALIIIQIFIVINV